MARSTEPAAPLRAPSEYLRDSEFRDLLTVNVEDGRIWLADRRMMLMDVASFAAIRKQLIDTCGIENARRFLTSLGYRAGLADAELMRRRWPDDPARQRAAPHPFLGVTKIEPVTASRDKQGRLVESEWLWQNCVEADAHIQSYGLGTYPACWIEAGYAMGFAAGFGGPRVLYREVTCRSMGSPVCRVVGRLEDRWSARERGEILQYLEGPGQTAPRQQPSRESEVMLTANHAWVGRNTIVGRSPALKGAVELLQSVAETDATVLISGESGVGKELFTRTLHSLSKRARGPFVAINCAAIPETLIESELFGVERGAFTGATHSRPGRFERAAGGTLFLDEVALLNHVSQAKLLRALQEGEIERIGGTRPIKVDVRVVAATNISLTAAVEERRFRDDLFFRLNVFPIHLPPLRERRDDIPGLLQHYLRHFNERHGKSVPGFTRAALDALLHYRYPGNIRELENLVERAVILAKDVPIDRAHLFAGGEALNSSLLSISARGKLIPTATNPRALPEMSTDDLLEAIASRVLSATDSAEPLSWPGLEAQLLDILAERALERNEGNITAAARLLGLERHQLAYRLRRKAKRT